MLFKSDDRNVYYFSFFVDYGFAPSEACPIVFAVTGAIDISQENQDSTASILAYSYYGNPFESTNKERRWSNKFGDRNRVWISCPDTLPSTIVTKKSKWHSKSGMPRDKKAVTIRGMC